METVWKGRTGEAAVVASLVKDRWEVYLPTFGNGVCDLIAMRSDGRLIRVETKCTSRAAQSRLKGTRPAIPGAWEASLRQVRANKSTMTVKKFCAANSDVLAVYIAPIDAVAFLWSEPIDGRTAVVIREETMAGSLSELLNRVGYEVEG